jgi:hypothetical protein
MAIWNCSYQRRTDRQMDRQPDGHAIGRTKVTHKHQTPCHDAQATETNRTQLPCLACIIGHLEPV